MRFITCINWRGEKKWASKDKGRGRMKARSQTAEGMNLELQLFQLAQTQQKTWLFPGDNCNKYKRTLNSYIGIYIKKGEYFRRQTLIPSTYLTNLLVLVGEIPPYFLCIILAVPAGYKHCYQQILCLETLKVPAGQAAINCLTKWKNTKRGAVKEERTEEHICELFRGNPCKYSLWQEKISDRDMFSKPFVCLSVRKITQNLLSHI